MSTNSPGSAQASKDEGRKPSVFGKRYMRTAGSMDTEQQEHLEQQGKDKQGTVCAVFSMIYVGALVSSVLWVYFWWI